MRAATTNLTVLLEDPECPGAGPRSETKINQRLTQVHAARQVVKMTSAESSDVIEALSNPFLYHRPILLPALQALVESLKDAHTCVEAYASGEYMTDRPIVLAFSRISTAWTTFISPLNALSGLRARQRPEWNEEEERKRKAVGRRLFVLAVEKQRCVSACT